MYMKSACLCARIFRKKIRSNQTKQLTLIKHRIAIFYTLLTTGCYRYIFSISINQPLSKFQQFGYHHLAHYKSIQIPEEFLII